jgi:hypothetical protein
LLSSFARGRACGAASLQAGRGKITGHEAGRYDTFRRPLVIESRKIRMHLFSRAAATALLGLAFAIGLEAGTASAQIKVIVGEKAMPAPIVEVVPAARPGEAWVPGHWVWREKGWVWVKGHFETGAVPAMPEPIVEVVPARPSPGHVWVKGHYAWEGGRWAWHPGIWVRL